MDLPLLCRWSLHRWRTIDAGWMQGTGFVYAQECRRCHRLRQGFWL